MSSTPHTRPDERPATERRPPSPRPEPLNLVIADDDLLQARLLKANLDRPGRVMAEVVGSAADVITRVGRGGVDAIVTDLAMPDVNGIDLVRRIREVDAGLPIIIITAFASVELAVEGIRAGATDFLQKPVNVDALVLLIERAVSERTVRDELSDRKRRAATTAEAYIFGTHPRLDEVRRFAGRLAGVPGARLLVTGESGTGKSLLARAVHELSGDSGRFVEVNCAALPAPLLESELFGHERGAFTDAKSLKRGLIELADRGTLFFDEIGAMPLELQAKLLLFLETREIRRVGGVHPIPVRTRVIAATNEDLHERVRNRQFRQDLFYRLDVTAVHLPALREMPEVVPQLAERFVRDICADLRRPVPVLTSSSFARLGEYPWPGNARELRNAVERALIFHEEDPLIVAPPVKTASPDGGALELDGVTLEHGLSLEEVERRYLASMLAGSDAELGKLAERLGISRKTLWEKRRRYGL